MGNKYENQFSKLGRSVIKNFDNRGWHHCVVLRDKTESVGLVEAGFNLLPLADVATRAIVSLHHHRVRKTYMAMSVVPSPLDCSSIKAD